jgi:ectoine hydroxylase-related dioxygenase (phytanoyl-CoA dioxygenase family)
LLVKAPATQELALNPLVLGVIDGTLRGKDPSAPKCDGVELSATQAIGIEPGEPPQFLHRDEDIWPFPHDFEIMAPVMWTLSAFTADNGATRFIPGSHLWPRDRQPLPGEAIAAEAPPGSAIVWLGGTLHGGGANRTSEIRKGLAFAYRLGWLAPQEKLLLTIPPDQARDMPEKLQRLIGYQVHRPALGVIEGRDPIEWLRGETRDLAPAQDHLTPQHNAMLADMTERPSAYEGFIT